MANNILGTPYSATLANLYAIIRNQAGQVLTVSGLTFGTYTTANLANYVIALTEQGTASRFYILTFPALSAGQYFVTIYLRAGGSAAEGDTAVAQGDVEWDGAELIEQTEFMRSGADGDTGKTLSDQIDALPTSVAIASAVEAAILDEGDATALLAAIAAKVEEFLVNDGDATATLAAIATAVWANAGRTLTAGTNIVLSKGTGITGFNDLDAAGVRSAVGLASANLDTQIADLPTVAEFEARTIIAGSYFDPAADIVAHVTLVDTTTTNADMRGTDNAALASICTETRLAELDAANLPADVDTLKTRITEALFDGITSLAQWLGLLAGKQAGDSTAQTELRATGAGGGTYDETTDSSEALRDRGDSSWVTATGFSTLDAAGVWDHVTRTLTAGTNIALAKGTGVTGFNDLDSAGIRTAVGMASANLDTQLDAIPTNSDLVTALAAADDAVLSAIGSLNNLSSAGAQAAAAAALTAYGAAIQTTSLAVKAKTDLITSDPALQTTALAIKAKTDTIPANPAAVSNIPTAAQNAAAVLAAGNVDGYTLEQTLRLCLAALAGKIAGAQTTTITIRAADDSKSRILATVDAYGNRTTITLDAA